MLADEFKKRFLERQFQNLFTQMFILTIFQSITISVETSFDNTRV